jgi:hypothetical protein
MMMIESVPEFFFNFSLKNVIFQMQEVIIIVLIENVSDKYLSHDHPHFISE